MLNFKIDLVKEPYWDVNLRSQCKIYTGETSGQWACDNHSCITRLAPVDRMIPGDH